ncbi:MAG: glycosyltransferase family 4 protein [Thermoflexales bacterium]|nr:glycosyltransferase family 4 protein [Thermoflexales bacterium]
MNILFLLTQDLESPTGVGRFFPLARELVRLGHNVNIVALHGNYRALETRQFAKEGVNVFYVGQMHVLKTQTRKRYFPAPLLLAISAKATTHLTKAALQIPADVVHIAKPHPMNSIAGLIVKQIKGCKLVLDCSDYEAATNYFSANWQRWVVAFFEDRMPQLVDCVTTHSSFLRNRLLKLGLPPGKIVYLPNGVDYERFGDIDQQQLAVLRSSLGLWEKRVVIFVGTLTAHAHAVDLLLRAFQEVRQRIPNSVLLIVGGGENYESLLQLAKTLGVSEATIFCGRVPADQVKYYYRLAEVSVDPVYDTPAAWARFPIKLFESWVNGVPFVTGDVGDRRALLEQPCAGLVVTPGDATALADAIIQVLQNPDLAEEMRRNGFERAREFDWAKIAIRMEKIYRSLVANEPL